MRPPAYGWSRSALLVCLAAAVSPALAADGEIPAVLEPWRGWVLDDVANLGCPSPYDDAGERIAVWPSALELSVTAAGGSWTLDVDAFCRSWLPLPGNADAWPMAVTLDGKPAAVVARDGVPSIRVEPGRYVVGGEFRWSRLPERLAVPKAIGIVSLVREQTPVALPELDAGGWLWLERSRPAEAEQDQLTVQLAGARGWPADLAANRNRTQRVRPQP